MAAEMSLNDIIAMNRKLKKAKNAKRGSRQSTFKNHRNVVISGRPNFKKVSGAKISQKPVSIDSKIVRINLSNLAPTVVSADLHELFATFNAETATVHYNENGQSLGTGDVFLPRKDGIRAAKEFAGGAIDGKVFRMMLVDETNQKKTPSRQDLPRRGAIGAVLKRANRGAPRPINKIQKKGGIRTKQVRKTVEELDAELDAYMAGESVPTNVNSTKTHKKGGKRTKQPQKTMEELDAELDAYMKKTST